MNRRFRKRCEDWPLRDESQKKAAFAALLHGDVSRSILTDLGVEISAPRAPSESLALRGVEQMLTPCHAACERARMHGITAR